MGSLPPGLEHLAGEIRGHLPHARLQTDGRFEGALTDGRGLGRAPTRNARASELRAGVARQLTELLDRSQIGDMNLAIFAIPTPEPPLPTLRLFRCQSTEDRQDAVVQPADLLRADDDAHRFVED